MQLRPSTLPNWTKNNNNSSQKHGSLPFRQDGISCPVGTVIVKRTTAEDLIQAQRLNIMGFKHSRYVSSKSKNIDLTGFHVLISLINNILHVEKFPTYNEHLSLFSSYFFSLYSSLLWLSTNILIMEQRETLIFGNRKFHLINSVLEV